MIGGRGRREEGRGRRRRRRKEQGHNRGIGKIPQELPTLQPPTLQPPTLLMTPLHLQIRCLDHHPFCLAAPTVPPQPHSHVMHDSANRVTIPEANCGFRSGNTWWLTSPNTLHGCMHAKALKTIWNSALPIQKILVAQYGMRRVASSRGQ